MTDSSSVVRIARDDGRWDALAPGRSRPESDPERVATLIGCVIRVLVVPLCAGEELITRRTFVPLILLWVLTYRDHPQRADTPPATLWADSCEAMATGTHTLGGWSHRARSQREPRGFRLDLKSVRRSRPTCTR